MEPPLLDYNWWTLQVNFKNNVNGISQVVHLTDNFLDRTVQLSHIPKDVHTKITTKHHFITQTVYILEPKHKLFHILGLDIDNKLSIQPTN